MANLGSNNGHSYDHVTLNKADMTPTQKFDGRVECFIRYKMSLRSNRLRGIEKQSRQNIENPVSRSFFASQPHR